MHLSDQKKELRQSIAQRFSRMTPEEREAESRSICRRIVEHIPEGSTVCVYSALKTEPDLRLLINTLLEREDDVFMASFVDQKLAFRHIEDLDHLVKGKLNILEPPLSAHLLPAEQDVIVVVPGRAFDRQCNRMGRGNGGYDIWIKKKKAKSTITTIGAAFESQIVREVPMEEHDEALDMVMTGREIYQRENAV